MNDLNNSQIILLALFVSFVSSVATGIVTVTLLEEAPAGITNTINRVVERTVVRVIPNEVKERIIEERIVIKEQEDSVVETIKNSSLALVSIFNEEDLALNESDSVDSAKGEELLAEGSKEADIIPLATGFIIRDDGMVITITNSVPDGISLIASLENGVTWPLKRVYAHKETSLLFLELEGIKEKGTEFSYLELGSPGILLGQTAIIMGVNKVSVGIISGLERNDEEEITRIDTDILGTALFPFAVILNTDEQIVGFNISGKFITGVKVGSIISSFEEEIGSADSQVKVDES